MHVFYNPKYKISKTFGRRLKFAKRFKQDYLRHSFGGFTFIIIKYYPISYPIHS